MSIPVGTEGPSFAGGATSTVRARLSDTLFAEDSCTLLKTVGVVFFCSGMCKAKTANAHIKAHKARMPVPASSVLLAPGLTRMSQTVAFSRGAEKNCLPAIEYSILRGSRNFHLAIGPISPFPLH
jgi:hypothetical protein